MYVHMTIGIFLILYYLRCLWGAQKLCQETILVVHLIQLKLAWNMKNNFRVAFSLVLTVRFSA